MRSNLKKFRLNRASKDQPAPDDNGPDQAPQNVAMDQKTRIEQAVRKRMARTAKDEEEAKKTKAALPEQEPEQEIVPEAPISENIDPEQDDESTLTAREEINKIKRENLTGRQLRIARRQAQKHGLQATSDLDAVRLLRKRGIDPFTRGELMEVNTPDQPASLPATRRKTKVGPAAQPAAPQVIDDNTREREIRKIQRGLVDRRRRRLAVLIVKLACYVALPSLIAGYYFYRVATPMYATYTEFVIQQGDAPSALPTKSLLSASPFAMVTDSIVVQGYLTSRDAMKRLDNDLGFRSLYQGDNIDVLQRLPMDATDEEAYKVYLKKVVIGYDPTEGVIKMEVISPAAETSLKISKALLKFAEQRVDQQTKRAREDTMRGAEKGYQEAEDRLSDAQNEVADLQRKLNTFDTAATFSMIQGQIGELESRILEKELERAEMIANPRPNKVKLKVLDEKLKVLNRKLKEKKQLITQGSDGNSSIVEINAELTRAQANLALRQELLGNSLAALESARVDANRQTRFISMGVAPVQSDQAAYPRAFENTLLSIIVFAGIYMMISLTVSILREQVTT